MRKTRVANEKGQSILEYSVVFVAIVSVILVAAPMFLKPSVNRYYESAGTFIEATANGMDTMAASIPGKFSSNWSDYSFDSSLNNPVVVPSYAEATSGMGELWQKHESADWASTGTSGGGGSSGGWVGGCTGWPC